ncbi:MAG TPA: hypothetical protein DD628_01005, partial [Clostridiales bacterium]|nr:hypothetical protein [Candidatus Apopatosoma intestinale]
KSTIKEKFLYVSSRVVEGADPYKLKPKYSQQPKQKIYAYPLFLLHIQAQKKKLSKRKRRNWAFALCGARPTPSSARAAFPKMRAKTLMGWRKLYYSEKNY